MKFTLRPWVPLLPFVLFLVAFFTLMQTAYPLIGQDYLLFFPRLLAGHWHFEGAGLLPFRYIPHLCGGLPLYGNPQDIYYSLLQLFSFFGDLRVTTHIVIGLTLLAGYAGWYRFGHDIIRLEKQTSHLLALVIVSNGYYVMHMVAGHLTFHTTPLIGWFLWLLFQRDATPSKIRMLHSAIFGLLAAFVLYAGGYFVLMQTAVAIVLIIPFDLLLHHHMRLRVIELSKNILWLLPVAMLTCASKFVAVFAMMRFFPRYLPFTQFTTEQSMLTFFAKIFWRIPQNAMAFDAEQYPLGLHEFSMFLSPLLLIGLPVAIVVVMKRNSWPKRGMLVTWSLAVLFLFVQLARGYGWLADAIHEIPLFSSWRISIRFVYVLAILISIAGTYGIAHLLRTKLSKHASIVNMGIGLLSVLAFFAAYRHMMSPRFLDLTVPYDQVQLAIEQSNTYWTRPVIAVEDYREQNVSDLQYVLAGSTGKSCYEILLTNVSFLPDLQAGPIESVTDRYFNINNPACMQYPEANNCKPGDRIAVDDAANAQLFLIGEQPQWKLPWWQWTADLVSLISILLAGSFSCMFALVQWWPRPGSNR